MKKYIKSGTVDATDELKMMDYAIQYITGYMSKIRNRKMKYKDVKRYTLFMGFENKSVEDMILKEYRFYNWHSGGTFIVRYIGGGIFKMVSITPEDK